MGIKRPGQWDGPAASLGPLLLLLLLGASAQGTAAQNGGLSRGSFPKGFVFGTASAAYQERSLTSATPTSPSISTTVSRRTYSSWRTWGWTRTASPSRGRGFSQVRDAQLKSTTFYTRPNDTNIIGRLFNDTLADTGTVSLPFRNGKAIGDRANSIWLYIVPRGMRSLMNYVKDRYNSPPVYITENGMDDSNSPFTSLKDALKDGKRIKYHNDYLTNLAASIKEDGCDVRGYFAWSLLDNWEWAAGYSSRFGLYFVDYNDNLKRYPKNSVQWFKSLLGSSS